MGHSEQDRSVELASPQPTCGVTPVDTVAQKIHTTKPGFAAEGVPAATRWRWGTSGSATPRLPAQLLPEPTLTSRPCTRGLTADSTVAQLLAAVPGEVDRAERPVLVSARA